MMKCGCPSQDEINNILESFDWTNYLFAKVTETLKFLLHVDHLRYRNLDLGRLNPTCAYSGRFMLNIPIGLIDYYCPEQA